MAEESGEKVGPPSGELSGSARTQFGKGRDPRERLLKRAAEKDRPVPELVPVEGEGMLAAMRHVLLNPAEHDTTPYQKLARDHYAEDRRGFAKQFGDLERAERQAVVVAAEERAVERTPDAGTAKARNLIDRLLSKAAEAAELEVQT